MHESDSPPGSPQQRAEFSATHWSVILHARSDDSQRAAEALDQLCGRYWYPLYVYVRRQGFPPAEAQDITQGFFQQLIVRDSLKAIDQAKGLFRSFLMSSMKHFIINVRRDSRRLKRGGGEPAVVFEGDETEARFLEGMPHRGTPEQALDRCWATTVMEAALERLEAEYTANNKDMLFAGLKPYLSMVPEEGEYLEVATELGLTKNSVAVTVHRMRQRYGELIREEVADTVSHPLEVEEEMRHLFEILTSDP